MDGCHRAQAWHKRFPNSAKVGDHSAGARASTQLRDQQLLVIPLQDGTNRFARGLTGGVLDVHGHRGTLAELFVEQLQILLDRLTAAIGLTEDGKKICVLDLFRTAPGKSPVSLWCGSRPFYSCRK